ncbi:prepilin-type N-terminal cleavage/methylation domain-containing protein [bacterium]|jgi:prepilin-type N-terminal cleavage/methylation domain-containing protein|nr:prepilin-type N-terminal cleavage/methylation domain-containing protein [bacterium]MBT4632635.1 prepilin-type N-terminal cleavage/methylation domain-containing protein [bacterium]MBT6778345.1 prepilin-type N-terminal cleavage/methylation domain-containing protein [bacterium]
MLIIIINKNMKKINLRAFTFVELMIVMIIIAILGVV